MKKINVFIIHSINNAFFVHLARALNEVFDVSLSKWYLDENTDISMDSLKQIKEADLVIAIIAKDGQRIAHSVKEIDNAKAQEKPLFIFVETHGEYCPEFIKNQGALVYEYNPDKDYYDTLSDFAKWVSRKLLKPKIAFELATILALILLISIYKRYGQEIENNENP